MKTADNHFEYRDGDFHSAQYALKLQQRKVEGISVVAQVKARIVSAESSSGWKDQTYADRATSVY